MPENVDAKRQGPSELTICVRNRDSQALPFADLEWPGYLQFWKLGEGRAVRPVRKGDSLSWTRERFGLAVLIFVRFEGTRATTYYEDAAGADFTDSHSA